MNIIPKINGSFEIMSNKNLSIKNLNIIDEDNIFNEYTKELINSRFIGNDVVDVKFILNNKSNNYKIDIINGKIFVETPKELAYNALITILNLKEELYKDMYIIDYPKYSHREFSIDVARHYFSVDEVKKLIDEASRLKINKIHLHLSDNQGWRVEIKKYPILNDIGGKDGFYTKNELEDIVRYASVRHIEIIPEIDIPGHVGAILASLPEFSCDGKIKYLDEGYKTNDKTLCFGNEQTFNFVCDILDEIMDIFPSKYVHIGCDEVDLSHNKKCPKCREYILKKGFKNFNEVVLDFINKISKYLNDNKKEVIVWNDATRYGELNKEIIVQNWFNYPFDKTNFKEYENNRRFIFGSTIHTYFDYPVSLISLKNTYNYLPKINNYILNGNNILGISSHIWTEVINNNKDLEEKIFPRLIAFSENAWSKNLDYNDFLKRLEIYLKGLNDRGVSYNLNYLNNDKNEIITFFKTFLDSNDNKFSFYQSLVGMKLILNLLKESNHLNDIPDILIKTLKK